MAITSAPTLFSMTPTLIELRDEKVLLGRLYTRVLVDDDDSPKQSFQAAVDPIVPRGYEPASLQIYFDGNLVYDCNLVTRQELVNRISPDLLTKLINQGL